MVITLKEGAQLGKQNGLSNDGEAGENNVHAMHNTGYLNVPLNKVNGLLFARQTKLMQVYLHSCSKRNLQALNL